ncbi:hypothetical protein L7F22_030793 [Adiantum nelumboides]|nr:hypothetical protein [Adiantum nelumboides]
MDSFRPSEDYWEDASVSMRGEPPHQHEEDTEREAFWSSHGKLQPSDDPSIKPRRGGNPTHQNGSPSTTSEEPQRQHKFPLFPPPIPACQTTSFKKDARFVLQEVKPLPQSFLRADRHQPGRLRLELVESEPIDHDFAP